VRANPTELQYLVRIFERLNTPAGEFGRGAIKLSTAAIRGDDATYAAALNKLSILVDKRDALAAQIEATLDKIPGCGGFGPSDNRDALIHMGQDARVLLTYMQQSLDTFNANFDDGFPPDN
jgi:hypothetical protein